MPSQGRAWIMSSAAIHTLMRKLLELSWRPATRLSTRTRRGSTWVTNTTKNAPPTASSSKGKTRRQKGGHWRV